MGVGKTLAPIFYVRINGVYMDKNIDLQYAIDNGIIDLPNIQSIIEMKKRKDCFLKKWKIM